MPTRPTRYIRKASVHQQQILYSIPFEQPQHGLLFLPQESLTHITAYLSPPSLLALASTCRRLCDHVDDDNTWLRALLTQYLGISPEHELESDHVLLLKRTEPTWRREFIFRYTIRQRWERSRNPTITHAPQHSGIHGVHLMSEHGLLTSSIQYGIVARSVPLSGKVLKGYIDAAGTGLGIGNPNVEFTPNVSACAVTSDGGTARVFWGKRNGEVALVVANRVMDARAASDFIRCNLGDQHEAAVQQLVPDPDSNTFLSAGADGRIKLWNTKTLQFLWSTDKQEKLLVTDPFVYIAGSLSNGFVVGALKSGDILLYDLHASEITPGRNGVRSVHQLRIPSPLHNDMPQSVAPRDDPSQQIAKLWLYRTEDSSALVLVQYAHHPQLYHIHANVVSHDVTVTAFGDRGLSNVSAVEPVMSNSTCGSSMVIVGDLIGYVSIYDINIPNQQSVSPAYRFEAHTDGAVTAISWSPTVFATGSARGTTVIWDSLTLEPVRYFTTPAPRPPPGHDWESVSCILLDKGLVIIIVGNRVMTWKVGQVNVREHPRKKAKHANGKMNVITKGHQQHEMQKAIAESYRELEYERAHMQRRYGREREQRSTLDSLGLSEREAVEYILMLSRDEEEARQQTSVADEGMFVGDFDDLPGATSSLPGSSPSTSLSSHPSSPTHHPNSRSHPRGALPISNNKVQVSPPFVPEPMEAGTSISPLQSLSIGPSTMPVGVIQPSPIVIRSTSSSSLDHFPTLSSSLSSNASSKRSTSSEQSHSAWRTPLTSTTPLSGLSPPRSRVVMPVMARSLSGNVSLLSADVAQHKGASQVEMSSEEEMDADLKLAIELSLAEAQSGG